VTEKSEPEKSRLTEGQTEGESLSTEWLGILDKVHEEDFNEAYEAALNLGMRSSM
jgi:hypothetical protein